MKEIEYEVYCDNEFYASANDLEEAMRYAHDCRDDGPVEVYKVEKEITVIALLSTKKGSEL